jgi:hypothetical protein
MKLYASMIDFFHHEGHEEHEVRSFDYPNPSRTSYYCVSKFARDAQIFRHGRHLGVGSFSREGAKTPSSEKNFFSSKPLRLRAFAGDIPRFGCGSGALGPSW